MLLYFSRYRCHRMVALCLFLLTMCFQFPTYAQLQPDKDVEISVAKSMLVAGQWCPLQWKIGKAYPEHAMLVVGFPPSVRFKGDGFYAVQQGARGPFSVKSLLDRVRLFVPLNGQAGSQAGSADFRLGEEGEVTLAWKITTPSPAAEVILASGEIRVSVQPDRPTLTMRDRFATETKVSERNSSDGKYRLKVYSNYFQVVEIGSNALMLERGGSEPVFSPTGRYVTSKLSSGAFEINDVLMGSTVYSFDTESLVLIGYPVAIAWINNDAIMVAMFGRKGAVGVFAPLIDNRLWLGSWYSCNACDALSDVSLLMDLDRLFLKIVPFPGFESDDEPSLFSLIGEVTPWKFSADHIQVRDGLSISSNRRRGHATWRTTDKIIFTVGGNKHPNIVEHSLRPSPHRIPKLTSASAKTAAVTFRETSVGGIRLTPLNRAERFASAFAQLNLGLENTRDGSERNIAGNWRDDVRGKQSQAAGAMIRVALGRRVHDSLIAQEVSPYRRNGAAPDGRLSPAIISLDYLQAMWNFNLPTGVLFVTQHVDGWGTAPDIYGDIVALFIPNDFDKDPVIKRIAVADTSGSDYEFNATPEGELGLRLDLQSVPRLVVSMAGVDRLLIASKTSGKSIVLDVPSLERVGLADAVDNASGIVHLALTSSKEHLAVLNVNGDVTIADVRTGAPVAFGRFIDDELLLHDAQMVFEMSAEAASLITLRVPGRNDLYSFDQFSELAQGRGAMAALLNGQPAPKPDTIAFRAPTLAAQKTDQGYQLTVSHEAGLNSISAFVDGRFYKRYPLDGRQSELTLSSAEFHPCRSLTFVAESARGLRSHAMTFSFNLPKMAGTLRVRAIGVDTYNSSAVADLRYAATDAAAFSQAVTNTLGSAYASVNSRVLLARRGERVFPNAATVTRFIEAAVAESSAEDTLVLYMSGHGRLRNGEFELVLPAGGSENEGLSTLTFRRLAQSLSAHQGRIFVFLDTCHSAGATHEQAVAALIQANPSIVLMTASKGNQTSAEGPAYGGGVFTTELINALRASRVQNAQLLTIDGLYNAVKQGVVQRTDGRQTPWLRRPMWIGPQTLN